MISFLTLCFKIAFADILEKVFGARLSFGVLYGWGSSMMVVQTDTDTVFKTTHNYPPT